MIYIQHIPKRAINVSGEVDDSSASRCSQENAGIVSVDRRREDGLHWKVGIAGNNFERRKGISERRNFHLIHGIDNACCILNAGQERVIRILPALFAQRKIRVQHRSLDIACIIHSKQRSKSKVFPANTPLIVERGFESCYDAASTVNEIANLLALRIGQRSNVGKNQCTEL